MIHFFGGTLNKAFQSLQDSDNEAISSRKMSPKNKELDKLISGLLLNVLMDTNFLKDNQSTDSSNKCFLLLSMLNLID